MKVIGLTGGIGSGKSTVSRFLAELGAVVIDADKVGHEVFRPGTDAWQEVVDAFGQDIVATDGTIDRGKLGMIIFSDPEARSRLNQIMHLRIYERIKEQIKACQKKGVEVVVVEAPLLLEAGWKSLVDEVWVTRAPQPVVLKRLKQQKGLSGEQALARISAQMTSEQRVKQADVVINTDFTLDELKIKVGELWRKLKARI